MGYRHLDNILKQYIILPQAKLNRHPESYLNLVSFAVVRWHDKVLAVLKGNGDLVLGFGGACMYEQARRDESIKGTAIDTIHRELDRYIPNVGYHISINGLIHSQDRLYDRANIGCFFNVDITDASMRPRLLGERIVYFAAMEKMTACHVRGWSKNIARMICSSAIKESQLVVSNSRIIRAA